MFLKRPSDFMREARIESAGFQIESGDGLSERELRTDQMFGRDFRSEFAGWQAAEIVSTYTDANG
jgi:hypothetical protein